MHSSKKLGSLFTILGATATAAYGIEPEPSRDSEITLHVVEPRAVDWTSITLEGRTATGQKDLRVKVEVRDGALFNVAIDLEGDKYSIPGWLFRGVTAPDLQLTSIVYTPAAGDGKRIELITFRINYRERGMPSSTQCDEQFAQAEFTLELRPGTLERVLYGPCHEFRSKTAGALNTWRGNSN
jgi:hypothetical protein